MPVSTNAWAKNSENVRTDAQRQAENVKLFDMYKKTCVLDDGGLSAEDGVPSDAGGVAQSDRRMGGKGKRARTWRAKYQYEPGGITGRSPPSRMSNLGAQCRRKSENMDVA